MSTEWDSVLENWDAVYLLEVDGGLMAFNGEPEAEVAAGDDELRRVMQSFEAEISNVSLAPDNADVMILASSSSFIITHEILQDSVMEDIFEGVGGDGCSLNWEGSSHEMEDWYADACMDVGDMVAYGEYPTENYSPLWQ